MRDMDGFYFNKFGEHYYKRTITKKVKIPKGCIDLWKDVKSPVYNYSYSNELSQNALICTTANFPSFINPKEFELCSAYSDRLAGWDYAHYQELCKMVGCGEQAWAYKLSGLGDEKLKEIAKFAFKKTKFPIHVRFIHAYNIATGYSCPIIQAIF